MKKEFGPENLPLRMKVFTIIRSTSMELRFLIREACISMVQAVGEAVLKFLPKIRTSTLSRMFPTARLARIYISLRLLTHSGDALYILLLIMIRTHLPVILYSISSMVWVRMKQDGMFRGKQTLFLTT